MAGESYSPEAEFFGLSIDELKDLSEDFKYIGEFSLAGRDSEALKGEIFTLCAEFSGEWMSQALPELLKNHENKAFVRRHLRGKKSHEEIFDEVELHLKIESSAGWGFDAPIAKIDTVQLLVTETDTENDIILLRIFELDEEGRLVYNVGIVQEDERLDRLAGDPRTKEFNDMLDGTLSSEVVDVPVAHYDQLGQMNELYQYLQLITAATGTNS